MAYIVAFAFLVLLGLLFTNDLSDAVLRSSFQPISLGVELILGPLIWMMLFIMMPAVTMRSLADEQRMGTLEILLTAPVRDRELVIGKWLGGMLLVLSIFAITLIYPLILNLLVDPGIDAGQLMAGYLGLILFAGALIAIGVAVSSFFSNPNAALVTNYVVVLLLWFIRPASQSGGDIGGQIIAYLNFIDHYVNFFHGVVDLRDITYYVSVIALSLFFGTISIESRRWR
jgi:ABC-2 type transport system permease protein